MSDIDPKPSFAKGKNRPDVAGSGRFKSISWRADPLRQPQWPAWIRYHAGPPCALARKGRLHVRAQSQIIRKDSVFKKFLYVTAIVAAANSLSACADDVKEPKCSDLKRNDTEMLKKRMRSMKPTFQTSR